jgi:hypothetical protein
MNLRDLFWMTVTILFMMVVMSPFVIVGIQSTVNY